MYTSCFPFGFEVASEVALVVEELAALSDIPPQGSGVGVWVLVDEVAAGMPLSSVVMADSDAALMGSGAGVLTHGVGVLPQGWEVASAKVLLAYASHER